VSMGRRRWLATLLGMALVVASCGNSDGADSADGGSRDTIASSPEDEATRAADDPTADDETTTTTEATTTTEPETTTTTEPEIDPEDLLTPVAPGGRCDDVVALQERLQELGLGPRSADGDYGRQTEAAVSIFQELADVRPTGEADEATMRALATWSYDGVILAAGDEGDDVEELQQRLADGPFDPGPIDGKYGPATIQAVWALEKLAGVPVDDDWGPADELAWQRLMDGEVGQPEMDHDQRWVEVDLSDQLAKIYDPGETTPTLVIHISSGSGVPWSNEGHSGSSVTPKGDYEISRRISGWRESSLDIGRLYNPLYFNGGIAFHGALSVPLYPASHGCVRVPMHIAEYLPDELANGTPVHILA
jgi:peptidoglycan hydrolase-like protein with peptidoglycan-binding domain